MSQEFISTYLFCESVHHIDNKMRKYISLNSVHTQFISVRFGIHRVIDNPKRLFTIILSMSKGILADDR